MAIPEAQLKTWASQGATDTSASTYQTIKLALESADATYANKSPKIFSQGSYRNDTNIWKESDVDVVLMTNSMFSYDMSGLPPPQQAAFSAAHNDTTYSYAEFKAAVLLTLRARFGNAVVPGTKAFTINALHNRRKSDVLVAINHKKFSRFTALHNEEAVEGIAFYKSEGTKVVNYPKLHRSNLAARNQMTSGWLKHIVRIFKNARERMITNELIDEGIAPSYFIEGLLFNAPVDRFGDTYDDSMVKCINWLRAADQTTFVCPNRQYKLLDGGDDISWTSANCETFLNALAEFWTHFDD